MRPTSARVSGPQQPREDVERRQQEVEHRSRIPPHDEQRHEVLEDRHERRHDEHDACRGRARRSMPSSAAQNTVATVTMQAHQQAHRDEEQHGIVEVRPEAARSAVRARPSAAATAASGR